MRAHILNAFIGALRLAAIVASAPALSSLGSSDDCTAPSTETIFVTVQAPTPVPSTVYVTVVASSIKVSLSEARTGTLTRFATLYSTTTSPRTFTEYISAAKTSSTGQVSDLYQITETAVVTITNVNLNPLPSGGSVTYTKTPAPNGLLNYVVENGTTYWLDGQTPVPSEPYIYATSVVTVVPVNPTEWASEHATSTTTLHSTIYYTEQYTLTETLESATSSGRVSAVTSASVGTGLPYVKPIGGWNATKTSSGSVYIGATNVVSVSSTGAGILGTGTPSFVLYSSFDLHKTSHSTISLSSYAAKSGFNAFSTLVSDPVTTSISDPATATATSNSSDEVKTAVIDRKTVTLGGSSDATKDPLDTCTETPFTSPTAPYANSTFTTSTRATSVVSRTVTSLSSMPASVGYGSSSALINSTISTSLADGLLSLLSSVIDPHTPTSTVASFTSSVPGFDGLTSSSNSPSATLSSTPSPAVYSSSLTVASSSYGNSSVSVTSTPVYSSSSATSPVYSSKTSTSPAASATPSLCGEHGNFLLNFDDIPPLSIGNQNHNTVQPEPVFNPYHQFDFSDSFVVVPPPTDPYLPSSPPLLLEFIPNFNINGTNTQAGPNTAEGGYSGQISDGDADRTGCFHFNVYGASFGCDSQGPPCDFTFSGYQLDASRREVQITSQSVSVPACPALANCTLTPVTLDNTFKNLAFVRINVTVAQQPKIWWMDDLRLGWYDNSCATSLCRVQTHLP